MPKFPIPDAFLAEENYMRKTSLSSASAAALLECFCKDFPASVTARELGISRTTASAIYNKIRIRIMDLSNKEFSRFSPGTPMNEKLLTISATSKNGYILEFHKSRFRVFARLTQTPTASAYSGTSREKIKTAVAYSIPLKDAYTLLVTKNKRRALIFGKSSALDHDYQRIESIRRTNEETWHLEWFRQIDHEFPMPPRTSREEMIHMERTTRRALTCINHKLYPPGSNKRKDLMTFLNFTKARFMAMRGVSKKNFLLHLKESEWRFNHRSDDIAVLLRNELLARPL